MKSLYESILDNEDVLIGGIKKMSNNPFITLRIIWDDMNMDDHLGNYTLLKRWNNQVEDILNPLLPEGIVAYCDGHGDGNVVLAKLNGSDIAIISFTKDDREDYDEPIICVMVDYAFPNKVGARISKWFKEKFIPEYNFEPGNGKFVKVIKGGI